MFRPLTRMANMIIITGFLAATRASSSSTIGFGTIAVSSALDNRINVYGARLYISKVY